MKTTRHKTNNNSTETIKTRYRHGHGGYETGEFSSFLKMSTDCNFL